MPPSLPDDDPDKKPYSAKGIANMLGEAHDAYMRGDLAGSFALIESAIEISRANGDTFNEASALALSATFAQRTVNRAQAAARGEEALVAAVQSSNFRASAEASIALCVTYSEMGMIDEGMRMAEDARIYATQAKDMRLRSYAHTRTADAYVTREVVYGIPCTQAMLSHYRIARRLARGLPQPDPMVAALYNYMLSLKRLNLHPLDPTRLISRRRLKIAAHLSDQIMKLTAPESARAIRRFVVHNCALVWCISGRADEGLAIFQSQEAEYRALGGATFEIFESVYGLSEIAAGLIENGQKRLERLLLAPMPVGTFFANRILVRRALIGIAIKANAMDVACRHLLALETERRIEFNHQNVMRQAVDVRLRQLRDAKKEVDTDALTQLLNRRGFPAKIALAYERAQKQGRTLALAMLDIDRFKTVNDRFGHLVGDQVLRQVALIIKKHCGNNDLVGRYGGDEFVVAAFDTTKNELLARCEAIRQEVISTAPSQLGVTDPITISAGVSDSTEAIDVNSLIHQADHHLYFAKRRGRNSVQG